MSTWLALLLLLQGIPGRSTETGTISGIVRTADGRPAVGVRVSALTRPDTPADAADGAAMAALAQTDASGRYHLEEVPPGQYYISSGRIDLPTFYPGTLEMPRSTPVRITPGLAVSNIDFAIADASFTIAGISLAPSGFTVPLEVRVGGGGPVPVFSPAGFAVLSVSSKGLTRTAVPLSASSLPLPIPLLPEELEIRVVNAPAGYSVRSVNFGSTDLLAKPLRLSSADVPLPASPALTNGPAPAYTLRMASIDTGSGAINVAAGAMASTPVSVILVATPPPHAPGARVSGRLPDTGVRSLSISDSPGTLYADGSFEFFGVVPGRHTIVARGENAAAASFGVTLVVGELDISGLQPEAITIAPREMTKPLPSGGVAAGTLVPLSTLHGTLRSVTTGETLRGTVSIFGREAQISFGVGPDGKFEVPRLVPGTYNLQATVFDYFTVNESITVLDNDATVELQARRAY